MGSATARSALAAEPAKASAADIELFEAKVRPLLIDRCQSCHGAKKQWSSLRLDSSAALLKGGDNGPALVPGKPDDSELFKRVIETDVDLRMPPAEAGKPLSAEEVAILKRWIELGAPWPDSPTASADEVAKAHREHWAFQPVKKPTLPEVSRRDWIKTPVDQFILNRLEAAKLEPSPEADRRTLIRRATYDLTGLPPTLAEVEAFVADKSPQAYEKLIDRLLASPHYGEQWGRHWLDVARYSDTKGYVYGREERMFATSWPYRDWIVRAFNEDLPYNRFLLLQLAADQVAPDDRASWAAMGYLTLGRRFLGVSHDIIEDRIDVVTRGTMGLTVGCARCHDHKFDPIPTADYYSLYGVFKNSAERLEQIGEPEKRDQAYEAFEKDLQAKQSTFRKNLLKIRTQVTQRARERVSDYLLATRDMSKWPEEGFDVVIGEKDIIPGAVRRWNGYLFKAAQRNDPIFVAWRKFAELSEAEFTEQAAAITQELSQAKAEVVNPLVKLMFAEPPQSIEQVAQRYGRLFTEIDRQWLAACQRAEKKSAPAPKRLPDASAEALRQVLYGVGAPCTIPDEDIVSIDMLLDTNNLAKLWQGHGDIERTLIRSRVAPAFASVLVDSKELVEPRIFRRGSPGNLGDEVPRQFLSVVAGPKRKPFKHGSGRLEMAQAIVAPSNPLTARVWVNRVWMHHFGEGLVTTPSDFGTRAAPPSHPELLDWLAQQLMTHGWSTKHLHRQIMLSSAYRQASSSAKPTPTMKLAQSVDPENRLLWRMNVDRLTFEELRDTWLAVTGELDERRGGLPGELFPGAGVGSMRRTIYGRVDRQFLPSTFRLFDFANPDIHNPARLETTVPQQALFDMNHPFLAARARALAKRTEQTSDPGERAREMVRAVFGREPSDAQLASAREFIETAVEEPLPAPAPETLAWQYGYGEVIKVATNEGDKTANTGKAAPPSGDKAPPTWTFHPLPHFTGGAWQGGIVWPDGKLGWVQITANGGHPGNDHKHASIRRWTAPHDMTVSVKSTVAHHDSTGDGIHCSIVSNRHGLLKSADVYYTKQKLNIDSLEVKVGDTLDFIVDIRKLLQNDQHEWAPVIVELPADGKSKGKPAKATTWDANRDFAGPASALLTPWEQLAQVLLMANELVFVD